MYRCTYGTGNFILIAAFIACGISFFGPFWLAGKGPFWEKDSGGKNNSNKLNYSPDTVYEYGLWAMCHDGICQAFWQKDYQLQKDIFTETKWHLATQILYFIGAALVLLSVIYSQVQVCCDENALVFRILGAVLLFSFCVQTAAVAVFGGGAWNDYKAKSSPVLKVDWSSKDTDTVYFNWCFWLTIPGGALTLLSGLFYLIFDCTLERRRYK